MSDTVNPLLQGIKLPGRTFQLPSRGALYNDELDGTIVGGEVHVHPMTALTEINLKNPDLLFNGKAQCAGCAVLTSAAMQQRSQRLRQLH